MKFEPGKSGNPSGRPRGIGRLVREVLGEDMRAVIYVQRCIALGIPPEAEDLEKLGIKLTDRQRTFLTSFPPIKASDTTKSAEFARDTGWHKPKQTLELDGHVQVGTQDLTKMTREQLEDWIAAAERASEEDDDGQADAAESPPPG